MTFQVPKMGLFFSTGFYFKSKVIEASHKGKNIFVLISGDFFSTCTIFVFVTFFSRIVLIQSPQRIYNIHVFDEAFFLWTIRIPMVTKLFRVVAYGEELSLRNTHGISTELSCWVTWQIKYISPPAEDASTPQ